MRYQVKERGENDRIRRAKIFDFQGPDDETVNVLNANVNLWTAYPESFWVRPLPDPLGTTIIAPPAQIVGEYIQTKHDDA